MTVRTVAFWAWFAIAVVALGRLWSTFDAGLARASAVDGLAAVALAAAILVLGRVQYRAARAARGPRG